MKKIMTRRALRSTARDSKGFILVIGMLFLVVLTLLSITMFRSFGSLERSSANTRDKQRAFQVAEAALKYGEWWLTQANRGQGAGVSCSDFVDANTVTNMRVCPTALAEPDKVPWPGGMYYIPPGLAFAAGGGTTAGGDINYSARPALHIAYLGMNGASQLYQVTAVGYGGSSTTISVVQSVLELSSTTTALGP